ncbi:hypothetical protein J4217_03660 [Candidatus Pacearchaeota archaeon]|nr:hypothetical protein [uncultured archaeon]MBS3091515.1 hypothetical protein [Candidatus Pacearchaeota archaeon]
MELVAFLGNDKENWGQVKALCGRMQWNNIVLVKNKNANDFEIENAEVVEIDSNKSLIGIKNDLINKLKTRLKDFEVALSIASGNGKEHMALVSALLTLPVGVRLVVFTKEGVEFIN